ncbi:zinc-binding dehydrogenase [Amycolatopsis thermoflava]|uniref:zinc-binding dehydrogenase n=1 Tax=Amycolatopsis thermoflava TaxID=84480 RepID=UPI003808DBDF
MLGHEFGGYVVDRADDVTLGADGKPVTVGDLVAVRPNIADGTCPACLRGEPNLCANWGFIGLHGWGGGFSEYVVAPAENVYPMPAGAGAEDAAMVESLAVAWAAVRRSGAGKGTTGLVIGAGPVGLGLLLCLQAVGATRVVVSELSAARKTLAASLGADVVDPRERDAAEYVRSLTGGVGADVAFDASGAGTTTFAAALDGLRSGGTSVVVAMSHGHVQVDPGTLLTSEKTVTGSFAYWHQDFQGVIDAIADGRLRPERLVTSRIPLTDAVDRGLRHLLDGGRETEVKVLLTPQGPVSRSIG